MESSCSSSSSSSRYVCVVSIVLFFILILVPAGAGTSTSTSGARSVARTSTYTKFIKKSCRATTYPSLCYASLANQATIIRSDPKLLATAALSLCLETARSASVAMVKLSKMTHGVSRREVGAMRDCIEQLGDSVEELRNSMAEMKQFRSSNYYLFMNDIQTWVSAALTDDDTCTDGFASNGIHGKTKIAVRGRILRIAHLTSNALALINSYASLHG